MKEKLYTIPLSEAFEKETECPFCALFDLLENNAISYTLGPSYMEPESRIMTNKLGFCKKHYEKMYGEKNRLGLALMLSSHFDEIIAKYERCYDFSKEEKRGLFKKKTGETNFIDELNGSCFICDKINSEMDNFYDTFVYLWKREQSFREVVMKSKGFCLGHFDYIVKVAKEKMSEKAFEEFFSIVFEKQKEDLKRVREELGWFIKKFDYRFKDEPWNNSRTALKRMITKVASLNVEQE